MAWHSPPSLPFPPSFFHLNELSAHYVPFDYVPTTQTLHRLLCHYCDADFGLVLDT